MLVQGKKAQATPTVDDEERQLQEMRAAGFMGTPARPGGGGGGADGTPARGGSGGAGGDSGGAKPGERRIRREVWVKGADDKFEVGRSILAPSCKVEGGLGGQLLLCTPAARLGCPGESTKQRLDWIGCACVAGGVPVT